MVVKVPRSWECHRESLVWCLPRRWRAGNSPRASKCFRTIRNIETENEYWLSEPASKCLLSETTIFSHNKLPSHRPRATPLDHRAILASDLASKRMYAGE